MDLNLIKKEMEKENESEDEEIEDVECPVIPLSIAESIPLEHITNLKPYMERYYRNKYFVNFPKVGNFDTKICIHTNNVMVIFLADGHDIIRKCDGIDSISFQTKNNVDRANIKTRGKFKVGAQKVEPNTILCNLIRNGNSYPVYSGVYGRLIEINERIKLQPQLCYSDRDELGYIGIILPEPNKVKAIEDSLMSEADYRRRLEKFSSQT